MFSADLENLITFHCSFCISPFSALCSDSENKTIYVSNGWCYVKVGCCECKPPDAAFDCKHCTNLRPDPLCFQLQLKLGLVCVHWLCEYLMYSPKFWPCEEAGVERLGTGGFWVSALPPEWQLSSSSQISITWNQCPARLGAQQLLSLFLFTFLVELDVALY